MISSNLNDSIRQLALSGVGADEIAENFGLAEAEVLSVLAARKSTRSDSVIEKLEELAEDAVRVIQCVMHDEDAAPGDRLKAAMYVTDVAAGIRAPQAKLLPDVPVGLSDTLKAWMDTYHDNMKRASEAPAPRAHKQLIEV